MSAFYPRNSLSVTATIRGPESPLCSARMHLSQQTQCMLSPILSAHNEKIITMHQNVCLQAFMEEVVRRCHALGKSSILPNLSVMLSPSLGCVQRSVHRLSQFPTHAWLLCLGVLVWKSDVDVADRISVQVGSTHICDGDQERVLKRLPDTQH